MDKIKYIDRVTGGLKQEKTTSTFFLKALYNRRLGKLPLEILIKRKLVSAIAGWLMNTKYSKSRIEEFIDEHSVDINEFIVPKGGFKHFNDFFYRKLKTGLRAIEKGFVSPADGKILVFEDIKDSNKHFIKGQEFNMYSFLKSEYLANRYRGGSMAIIRLAPADYHRYHFPCSGIASQSKDIKGAYYSVSPLALRKSLDIFCKNKKSVMTLDSDEYGKVLICDVGATMTGSIIQTYKAGSTVKKGDEKGYFAFGGSTLVLVFEKNSIIFDKDLIDNTRKGLETTVKMGETIAYI